MRYTQLRSHRNFRPHYHIPLIHFLSLPRMLSLLVVVLLITQVIVSNKLAVAGITLSHTEVAIAEVTEKNRGLEQQIASASAMRTIAEKAKELGFIATAKPLYLEIDLPVALDLR